MITDETDSNKPILSEFFSFKNALNSKHKVILCKKYVKFCTNNELEDETIDLNDIAGSIAEEPYDQDDLNAYLILNIYLKLPNNKRTKITRELVFAKFDKREDNLKVVKDWNYTLECLLNNNLKPKPFLVFINPNSGSGKANKIFLEHVVSVWNEANLYNQIVVTLYPNHAREYIKKEKLDGYRGIIVVSGDGLIYEIINGLFSRPDWEKAIKIPLGQIPAGSANGFASSIAYLSNEERKYDKIEVGAKMMAFLFSKFEPCCLDLVAIQLSNNSFVHSFMNVAWGLIADVDYESEQFRFLGGLRFLVGALRRILSLRIYKGRISFLPTDDMNDYKPKNASIKIIKNTNNYKDSNSIDDTLENKDLNLKYKYLKPLNEPVPNDWLTIEENFVFVLIVYLPLSGVDFLISPDSKFDDGSMVITYIKEGASKFELLKLFDHGEKGTFLQNPILEHVKVKAFRLEPLGDVNHENGNIMVDGEKVLYGPIQGEILPKLGRVLAKPTKC